ncbi:MAG: 16S rRNA (guanine(966)-N(2))-methyltransferase RsmD [Solidesulfovibrio sp. DCME]|uniref:16S rRNA (guanine(966)-N(2))-methyltransferase RsmD n=1 Tax=Solidesulfovibrio sp. DCME TaxID=3447380 RepID=UPI003D0A4D70
MSLRVIAGRFGGRRLKVMEAAGLRPATGRVREALFSMLEARGALFPGAKVLDLFAGAGSVGIEAVSRGAGECLFVEKNPAVARLLRENLRSLKLSPAEATVVEADVARALPRLAGRAFDLIAVDPPYGQGLFPPALAAIAAHGLLSPDGVVVAEIEAEAAFDPKDAPSCLSVVTDRAYGQTRIILWTPCETASPSTPEPSTP